MAEDIRAGGSTSGFPELSATAKAMKEVRIQLSATAKAMKDVRIHRGIIFAPGVLCQGESRNSDSLGPRRR
jgi:hypothetical protein